MTETGPIREVAQETSVTAPLHPRMRLLYLVIDLAVLGICTAGLSQSHSPLVLLLLVLAEAVLLLCSLQVGLRVFSPVATARRAAAFSDVTRQRLRGLRTALTLGGTFGLCVSFIIKHATDSSHNYGSIFLFCMFGVTDAISDLLGEADATRVQLGPRKPVDWSTIRPLYSSHWGEPPRSV